MRLLATSIIVLAIVIAVTAAQSSQVVAGFSPSPRFLPHPEDMVYLTDLVDTNTAAPEVVYEVPSGKWLVLLSQQTQLLGGEEGTYVRWTDSSGNPLPHQPGTGLPWLGVGHGLVGVPVPPGSRLEVYDPTAVSIGIGVRSLNGYYVEA